jgi:hypothetical protein
MGWASFKEIPIFAKAVIEETVTMTEVCMHGYIPSMLSSNPFEPEVITYYISFFFSIHGFSESSAND